MADQNGKQNERSIHVDTESRTGANKIGEWSKRLIGGVCENPAVLEERLEGRRRKAGDKTSKN